jgi:hypothetical protein
MKTYTTGIVVLLTMAFVGKAWAGLDNTNATPQQLRLVLDLVDGSRVIGLPHIEVMSVKTTYANLDVPLNQLQTIQMGEDHETVSLDFQNGDKLNGNISLESIKLETIFGKVAVGIEQIRTLRVLRLMGPLPEALVASLILHYSFDRDEGDKVSDQSGKGYDGVLHGGRLASHGQHGFACVFDGRRDYLQTRDSLDLSGAVPWTMSVWLKASGNPRGFDNIVSIGKSFVPRGIFGLGTGNDSLSMNANLWADANYSVKTDADYGRDFVHMAVVYDGERAVMCVNGNQKDDRKLDVAIARSPVWIGGRTGGYEGQYFNGIIDNVMIFNRALNTSEIKQIYNVQKQKE